jgi:hypothetical protein
MGQISPERRLPDAPFTAIRMIVERISDTASPSIETGQPRPCDRRTLQNWGRRRNDHFYHAFSCWWLSHCCPRSRSKHPEPNALRLGKLKGHGLIERDGPRYATASHHKVSRSLGHQRLRDAKPIPPFARQRSLHREGDSRRYLAL